MIHGRRDKRQIRRWEEQDAYTAWRHLLFWKPGERKKVKRRTHKWTRGQAKNQIDDELNGA